MGIALTVMLFVRPDLGITVRPERNPTYVTLSDGAIRNTYFVGIRNKHGDDREFQISLANDTNLNIELEGGAGSSGPT